VLGRVEDALLCCCGRSWSRWRWQILLRNALRRGLFLGEPAAARAGALGGDGRRHGRGPRGPAHHGRRGRPDCCRPARRYARALTDACAAAVCGVLAWHAAASSSRNTGARRSPSRACRLTCELILPLGFAVMGLRYLALGLGRVRGEEAPS